MDGPTLPIYEYMTNLTVREMLNFGLRRLVPDTDCHHDLHHLRHGEGPKAHTDRGSAFSLRSHVFSCSAVPAGCKWAVIAPNPPIITTGAVSLNNPEPSHSCGALQLDGHKPFLYIELLLWGVLHYPELHKSVRPVSKEIATMKFFCSKKTADTR